MARKRQLPCYISKELDEVITFLIKREDLTKIAFVRRAIRHFMQSGHQVDERVKIRERSHPCYIKREVFFISYVEEEDRERLEYIAKQEACTMSQAYFQALLNYSIALISLDDSGFEIKE